MSNMGYVRFQNTLEDLDDCNEHLWDNNLSDEEERVREDWLPVAKQRYNWQEIDPDDVATTLGE